MEEREKQGENILHAKRLRENEEDCTVGEEGEWGKK